MKFLNQLFSFKGRSGRLNFFLHCLIGELIMGSVFGVFFFLIEGLEPYVGYAIIGVTILVTFISIAAVTVRRYHDIDESGWKFFLLLVPLYGLMQVAILLFAEGDFAANQYGLPSNLKAQKRWLAEQEAKGNLNLD